MDSSTQISAKEKPQGGLSPQIYAAILSALEHKESPTKLSIQLWVTCATIH